MMSEAAEQTSKLIAVIACDARHAPIGTRSLLDEVLPQTLARLRQVRGVDEIVLLGNDEALKQYGVRVLPLNERPASQEKRVRTARAWGLNAWRGGAGQVTVFDEDFHTAALDAAAKATDAKHVLVINAYATLLDVELTSRLVQHHLYKNHEMRLTYTPAAPGLSGIVLQAAMLSEMSAQHVLPGQLLGYDPGAPTMDSLIRDACMQVDPALSKVQNRFLADTQRARSVMEQLATRSFASLAEMALEARRLSVPNAQPREIEIELTTQRLTTPPGTVKVERTAASADDWQRWLGQQKFLDDVLITVGGDGDPLLAGNLVPVLQAIRRSGVLSVHLQTDLVSDMAPLAAVIEQGLVDVISINFHGNDRGTYAAVAGADLFDTLMGNLRTLAEWTRSRGGLPLVVPRLLKVRQTIGQLEDFFDTYVRACGWAVIDAPSDRAGATSFAAVVDMAPAKRKPCRRILDRMKIGADGRAVACDQDVAGKLTLGTIGTHTIEQMWGGLNDVRALHNDGRWGELSPCATCREWYRP